MKKITLSEIFAKRNVSRVIALLLALSMLTLVGCNKDKTPDTSSGGSSSEPSQTESVDSSSEDASSENTSSKVSVDPLKGDITVDSKYGSSLPRSDANEIKPLADPAGNAYNYVGYAQKERDAMYKKITNASNTNVSKIKGTIYYVSTSGNDENDGKSPKTALRSVSAVDGLLLKSGDAVLFERGCIFRVTEKFYLEEGITYGSYGSGAKPVFLGSPKNFAKEIWKPSKKKNVWQMNYIYAYPTGAFFDQAKEIGYMRASIGDLTANTHFYLDEETATLYLYCDKGNPANAWESIEFSQSGIHFVIPSRVTDVTIDNLCLRYFGLHGIRGDYLNSGITVTNSEIGFIGGSWNDDNTVRYGNGIEFWNGGKDITIKNNWFYQVFDSAVSPQGTGGGEVLPAMENIVISNNLFEYNNADIEFWEKGHENTTVTPTKIKNWYMENNICRFTSLGWGTRADDGGIRGIDGVFFGHFRVSNETGLTNQVMNLNWRNNIVDCPGRAIYSFTVNTQEQYDAWKRTGNTYYIKQSYRSTDNLTASNFTALINQLNAMSAKTEKETLDAFKVFEPDAKVYWYK